MAEQAQRFAGQEQQIFEFYQSNPEMRAQLEAPIMEDKVVDFIVEMAQVSESKVSIEELLADPDGDEAEGGLSGGAGEAEADGAAEDVAADTENK